MKEYPIKTPSGNTYVVVEDVNENIFNIRLSTYHNLAVVFDKKVIPDLISILKEMDK
jgi:hypothetical protein